jgi:acetylornithine/succinyldiaminopimelate/putrescine aminotransferase/predicted amino acid dehydrogenase
MDDPLNPTLRKLLHLCRMDRTWIRGEGVCLWDDRGRRFLDFYSQYGAVALGHNAPAVVQAVQEALSQQMPAMVQPYLAAEAIALAVELQRLAPGSMSRCVFTTSGAQTVDTAIKMVRSATGRPLILAAHGSFHGKSLGALALTGQRQYAEGFGPLPAGVAHLPFGDADALESYLAGAGDQVAAFFVEPIQGEAGVIVPPRGYLRRVRELCTRHKIALVLDEIQTGLGRTGRLFASEHCGVAPDILLLAKGLGGGLFPLGACLASSAFSSEHFELRHSSTFANNNIACRVGRVVLDQLTRGGLCAAAAERGAQLQERLHALAHRYPGLIADVRGCGLLCALELRPFDANHGYFLSFLNQQGLYAYAVAGAIAELASLLVLPTLGEAPVLRLAPPLVIRSEEADAAMNSLEGVFAHLERNPDDTLLRALGVFEGKRSFADASEADLTFPPPKKVASPQPGCFAFLVHYPQPEDVRRTNPGLAHLGAQEMSRFCDFLGEFPPGVVMKTPTIASPQGASAAGYLIAVPLLPEQMARRGLRRMADKIKHAVDLAAALGAQVVGLGGATTSYSGKGCHVVGRGAAITTGSALTAGMTFAAVARWADRQALDLHNATIGIVGAGGSVGKLCARLAARARPARLLLIGSPRTGMAPLESLRVQLAQDAGMVEIATGLQRLAVCDVVISACGAAEPVLDQAALAPGTLVCDVARPPDASQHLRSRSDLTILEGGLVALPDARLRFGVGNLLDLPDGIQLACLAETILLTLAGVTGDFGIGDDSSLAEVDFVMSLAERHGFRLATLDGCRYARGPRD